MQRVDTPLFRFIFPAQSRTFKGKRWINIGLRTLHLVGVIGFGGAFLYDLPAELWYSYYLLTLYSGIGMLSLYLWSNAVFIIQLRGIAIAIKLIIFYFIEQGSPYAPIMLMVIIGISGFFAHAPGKIRYYSLYHRKEVKTL